jgi:hypothetical protein
VRLFWVVNLIQAPHFRLQEIISWLILLGYTRYFACRAWNAVLFPPQGKFPRQASYLGAAGSLRFFKWQSLVIQSVT